MRKSGRRSMHRSSRALTLRTKTFPVLPFSLRCKRPGIRKSGRRSMRCERTVNALAIRTDSIHARVRSRSRSTSRIHPGRPRSPPPRTAHTRQRESPRGRRGEAVSLFSSAEPAPRWLTARDVEERSPSVAHAQDHFLGARGATGRARRKRMGVALSSSRVGSVNLRFLADADAVAGRRTKRSLSVRGPC